MAERSLIRRIIAIFDRDSAKKAEREMEQSLGQAGKKGGENFLREMKKEFASKTAELKVALAKGIIDEKEFRRQADLAAKEFNAGILKGMEEARAAGTLTEREFAKLGRQLKKTGQEGETWMGRMRAAALRLGAAMLAAFSVRAIVNFGRDAIRAAAEAEATWANLEGTVRAAGVSFEEVEPKLRAAADQFERTTTHDDDAFASTLQRLIALTGDFGASLQNVMLVADVAARFFEGDLAQAADVVGRAMLGDTEQLKRLGIETKNAQEALNILAQRSFGAAAEQAATFSGQLQQLNNAWGNFKEAVGEAITTADGGVTTINVLTAVVQQMTRAVNENAGAVRTLGAILGWLFTEVIARGSALFLLPMAVILTSIATAYGLVARGAALAGQAMGANTAAIDEQIRKAEELAAALGKVAVAMGRTVIGGLQIPSAPTGPAPGPGSPGTPAVVIGGAQETAEEHAKAADEVTTVWGEAMKKIEQEGQANITLFKMLGQAWQQGGFAGIAALAKAKVRENIASALEMAARALGALGLGNVPAATAFGKSALQHTIAAGAWRALAGSGGGSSASGAAGGNLAQGAAGGLQQGASAQAPGAEVHIYLDPLDPRDPRVQAFHHETDKMVTERFGENANVTWHPRTKS